MKAEKTLLLVAFTLIVLALLVGITGANPANQANTTTGTIYTEGAHANTETVLSQDEISSTRGGFTFTGTQQHK
jgi:hypothetical protein